MNNFNKLPFDSALTLESMNEKLRAMEASNPRFYAEMKLLATLRRLDISVIHGLTRLAEKGMFDSLDDQFERDLRELL